MWCLPNIAAMNARAAGEAKALFRVAETGRDNQGRRLCCDICTRTADIIEPYFDVFSADPKGLLSLCRTCHESAGDETAGVFRCALCTRLMVANYTWECYSVPGSCDDHVCLTCALLTHVAESTNWLRLTKRRIRTITADEILAPPHLIAVQMPVPTSLKFVGNVEVDLETGGRLVSCMQCEPTPDGVVSEVQRLLYDARDAGHGRAILITDSIYQFSISVGVYVDGQACVPSTAPVRLSR